MPINIYTITCRVEGLYLAYAPGAGLWSSGTCYEEAANSLADELRSLQEGQETADERN